MLKQMDGVTFNEMLGQFIQEIEGQRFFRDSLQYVIPHLREHFGKRLLSEIDYKMLKAFRDKRERLLWEHDAERRRRKVNIEMEFLRRILSRAVERRILARSPFDGRRGLFYRDPIKKERALTESEIIHRLEAYRPKFKGKILLAALKTGLRVDDVCHLRWSQVDLDSATLRVVKAKGGVERTLRLDRDTVLLLKNLPRISSYIFADPRTGRPFKQAIGRSFEKALDRLNIERKEV